MKRRSRGRQPTTVFVKETPRFATADRHKKPIKAKKHLSKYCAPSDFKYDDERGRVLCPAGKELYLKNNNFWVRGLKGISYMAKITDCRSCHLRSRCLRNPTTKARQVTFFTGKTEYVKETFTQKMIQKIDSAKGRFMYSRRMGIVEPVFANIRSTLGLSRLTLRGKIKVHIQWLLFCLVHNLGKIYRYGPQRA